MLYQIEVSVSIKRQNTGNKYKYTARVCAPAAAAGGAYDYACHGRRPLISHPYNAEPEIQTTGTRVDAFVSRSIAKGELVACISSWTSQLERRCSVPPHPLAQALSPRKVCRDFELALRGALHPQGGEQLGVEAPVREHERRGLRVHPILRQDLQRQVKQQQTSSGSINYVFKLFLTLEAVSEYKKGI